MSSPRTLLNLSGREAKNACIRGWSRRGRWLRASAAATAVVFPFAGSAVAVTTNWNTNSNGSFTAAANWDNGVPDADDTAIFRRGTGVTYIVTMPGKPIIQGGTADYVNDRLRIGSNNVTFAQSSSFNLTPSTYSLTNNGAGDLSIAIGDTAGDIAVLTTNLLALNAPNVTIGHAAGANGTLNVSSGTFNVNGGGAFPQLSIGHFGTGTMNVANGAQVNMGGSFNHAHVGTFGTGTARVTGPGSTWTLSGELRVGNVGTGTLIIENGGRVVQTGTHASLSAGTIGFANLTGTSTATIRGEGSTWSIVKGLNVGSASDTNALLNVETGGMVSSEIGDIYGSGSATVRNPGSTWTTTGELAVGRGVGQGRLSIFSGGVVSSGSGRVGGYSFTEGLVDVSGGGARWTNATALEIGRDGIGTLNVFSAAQVSSANCFIASGGTGGSGTVTLSGTGATLSASGSITIGGLNRNNSGGTGTLTVNPGSTASAGVFISVQDKGTLNIFGGTVIADGFAHDSLSPGGTINFASGTIRITNFTTFRGGTDLAKALGNTHLLSAGRNLIVEGTASIETGVIIDGGSLTVGSLFGTGLNPVPDPGFLDFRRGTFNLTNQAIAIESGGVFGSALDVPDGLAFNTTLGITNRGLVTGDGRIGGPFLNDTAGELRAEPGRSLVLSGSGVANSGRVNLLGGLVEFPQGLTNNAGGIIAGAGTLIAGSGLTNHGQLRLSGGANIVGPVTNAAGGLIVVSGGGPATFFENVINNGEIRTSLGSFSVFFGSMTNNGTFSGLGTKLFEGGSSGFVGSLATPGSTTIEDGASIVAEHIREKSLTVRGDARIAPDGTDAGASRVAALDVSGQLDLTNNTLIVEGSDPSADLGRLRGYARSGFNGGAWDGPGVASSAARASRGTGLAVIRNIADSGDGPLFNQFAGQGVELDDLIVTFALNGDTDVDRDVDMDDYLRTDAGFLSAGGLEGWRWGDFNYDDRVDADDYWLIDVAFLKQHSVEFATALASGASVPEASAAGTLAFFVATGSRRRRRQDLRHLPGYGGVKGRAGSSGASAATQSNGYGIDLA